MNIKDFMAQTAYLLLVCLIVVAIADVAEISDMGTKYKQLYDACPCYAGKGIKTIGNYSPGYVFEVCNGTINKTYPFEYKISNWSVETWPTQP